MKSFMQKIAIGAATLAIGVAPLAASAQDWHHDHDRNVHQRIVQRDVHYTTVYRHPVRRYNEGYYGWAPSGYNGYYHNGGWYHHRRQQAGIWIYF